MTKINYASGEYSSRDLKNLLLEMGYEEEDLEGLRKAELVEKIEQGQTSNEDEDGFFDEVELDEDLPTLKEKGKKMTENPAWPKRGTAEWQEFVLSHFTEDEKWTFEEKDSAGKTRKLDTVKASGLARVGELLLGTPLSAGPIREELSFNGPKGLPYAYVCYRLVLQTSSGPREVTELADTSYLNTDDKFLAFPLASTTTKAMGRCWKTALGLSIYSKEEMPTKDTAKALEETTADWNGEEEISSHQRRAITNKCSKLRITVNRLLNVNSKYEYDGKVNRYDGLDDPRLTKQKGNGLIELLGKMERNEVVVHDSLKGSDNV